MDIIFIRRIGGIYSLFYVTLYKKNSHIFKFRFLYSIICGRYIENIDSYAATHFLHWRSAEASTTQNVVRSALRYVTLYRKLVFIFADKKGNIFIYLS